jgi:hypothetical protein
MIPESIQLGHNAYTGRDEQQSEMAQKGLGRCVQGLPGATAPGQQCEQTRHAQHRPRHWQTQRLRD